MLVLSILFQYHKPDGVENFILGEKINRIYNFSKFKVQFVGLKGWPAIVFSSADIKAI